MNKENLLRAALDAMHKSGIARAASPLLRGMGAVFMLHHILPAGHRQGGFSPNAGLEITADFLADVIRFVRSRGYLTVSLEQAYRIITGKEEARAPFVVFTLDDGYLDNLEQGLAVFKTNDCPFTIFISPAISDGTCQLWWRGLEQVIACNSQIAARIGGREYHLPATNDKERWHAFSTLYPLVRYMDEFAQRVWIEEFCSAHDVDLKYLCRTAAMTWDQVRLISRDPLCTIGAHTVNHFALARLGEKDALDEMIASRRRIATETGTRPDFFAYPYGDDLSAGAREFKLAEKAGFKAAVTTRKGLVYSEHRNHLHALPRLSLNGGYQQLRYVDVLMTGLPFALMNRFRKVNAA